MSAPEPMPCIAPECISPLSCAQTGKCKARQIDAARSYEEAIAACRQSGRIPDAWRDRG